MDARGEADLANVCIAPTPFFCPADIPLGGTITAVGLCYVDAASCDNGPNSCDDSSFSCSLSNACPADHPFVCARPSTVKQRPWTVSATLSLVGADPLAAADAMTDAAFLGQILSVPAPSVTVTSIVLGGSALMPSGGAGRRALAAPEDVAATALVSFNVSVAMESDTADIVGSLTDPVPGLIQFSGLTAGLGPSVTSAILQGTPLLMPPPSPPPAVTWSDLVSQVASQSRPIIQIGSDLYMNGASVRGAHVYLPNKNPWHLIRLLHRRRFFLARAPP